MKVSGTNKGKYYLISVGKEFTVKTIVGIKRVVEEGMQKGHNVVIFKLSKCAHMDSSGIGLLVNLSKRCQEKGGMVGYLKCTKPIKELFDVAGISSQHQYETEEELEADL